MGIFVRAPDLAPLPAVRIAEAIPWLGFACVVALCLGVAVLAPERLVLIPAALLGMGGAWLLLRHETLSIYAAIALLVFALNQEEGLQLNQVLYGMFVYAALGLWYFRQWASGQRFIRSRVDRLVALLLIGGLTVGTITGLLLGASLISIRGEVIAMTMLGFYFPVKEIARREERGPEILLGLLLFLGLFVAARNLLSFHAIVTGATELWQIAHARPGQGRIFNETQLMVGALGALSLMVFSRRFPITLSLGALFALLFFALILTRSRGYWLAVAFGLLALFVLLDSSTRYRMLLLATAALAGAVAAASVFLGQVADLVFGGTLYRLATLESALLTDVSMVNRIHEARAVLEGIARSPLLGWGLGAESTHYDLTFRATFTYAFIHNGYLALWFKLGIGGLVVTLGAWLGSIASGFRVLRDPAVGNLHRAVALVAVGSLAATLVSAMTSSPFFVRDQMVMLAILLGLAIGLGQRYGGTTSALRAIR